MLNMIRDSRCFLIMIVVSTNKFITNHLVVFTIFVDEGLAFCIFLGLLHIEEKKKYMLNI